MIQNKIKTRNLIVVDTFNEFVEKLNGIDSNVEDLVCYVTTLNMVLYGSNVESVWGPLGFTWDYTIPLGDNQYVQEKMEHVESDGTNIDYTQKSQEWKDAHELTKGYGHFNTSTMPFDIIPRLPDGYRIIQLNNTFTQIQANYIEVKKSDWSNLKEIHKLVRPGQSIKIDLTGMTFNENSQSIIDNTKISKVTATGGTKSGATVYIIGDLSSAINGVIEYNINDKPDEWTYHHTILLDDNNKGLNIPTSLSTTNQFYYPNENEQFDITDWFYKSNTPSKSYITLLAASKNYKIDWNFVEHIYSANGEVQLSPLSSLDINPYNYQGISKDITNPILKEITPSNVTIDATNSTGIIREDKLFGYRQEKYNTDGEGHDITYYLSHLYNPIQYIGNINSITMWNPFCLVKNDDDWPTYDQNMINKLSTVPDENWTKEYINPGAYFMYGSYIYLTKPSPYTIDCSNLETLNLFEKTYFNVSDYSNFRNIDTNKYALEVVQLTNVNLKSFSIGGYISTNNNYLKTRWPKSFYFTLPTLETITFGDNNTPCYFIPATSTITFNHWYSFGYDYIYVEDFTHQAFKFKYIDGRDPNNLIVYSNSLYFKPGISIKEVGTPNPNVPINLYDFDSRILNDTEYLKAAYINTLLGCVSSTQTGNSRAIDHPIIAVGQFANTKVAIYNDALNLNNDFIFIYNCDIEINYGDNANFSSAIPTLINKIIPAIQVNDTGQTRTVKIKRFVVNRLLEQNCDIVNILQNKNYTININ